MHIRRAFSASRMCSRPDQRLFQWAVSPASCVRRLLNAGRRSGASERRRSSGRWNQRSVSAESGARAVQHRDVPDELARRPAWPKHRPDQRGSRRHGSAISLLEVVTPRFSPTHAAFTAGSSAVKVSRRNTDTYRTAESGVLSGIARAGWGPLHGFIQSGRYHHRPILNLC